MKGFKSFARETIIDLDKHMNIFVGPNGSGKSNITDSLCFVLGRLSIKSIRAAKSSHLIFSGNKHYKGADLAYVEIVWDNTDKAFSIDSDEIAIRRTVNKSGQSTYKINNQVKTRQEVIELLSQAGIDPHGFNIVLQGEIMRFVRMPADERRKILEEVAGISIYEMRKEKSLRELEKTDEKLRQVNAILRERTNYLKNLENEREEALKFQKLQETVKRCKASIIKKQLQEKEKQHDEIIKRIEEKEKEIAKYDHTISEYKKQIEENNQKIEAIAKTIQKSAGVEQDTLLEEISILKQEYAGSLARKENFENKLLELERRKKALEDSLKNAEEEIQQMMKEKGKNVKKDLEIKKQKLQQHEEHKRKYYQLKSNVSSLTIQIEDKKKQVYGLKNESGFLIEQIQEIEKEISINESAEKQQKALAALKIFIESSTAKIAELEQALLEKEKELAVEYQIIKDSKEIHEQVSKLDTCPLCQTKITSEHKHHVFEKSDKQVSDATEKIEQLKEGIEKGKKEITALKNEIMEKAKETTKREISIIKLNTIEDKKQQLKRNEEKITLSEDEIKKLEGKKKILEEEIGVIKINEEQYENLKLEVNELERTEERNVGFEISAKQREVERTKLAIKQTSTDKDEIQQEVGELTGSISEKSASIEEKEAKAEELKKKYQEMYEEKNALQDAVRKVESQLLTKQNDKRMIENDINNKKIEKAQVSARIDSFQEELKEFPQVEFIALPIEKLKERLDHAEETLTRIGSVNMRALEVYDTIKGEYEKIKEKVDQLDKEKEEILRVIEQIDRKKKKTFVATLEKINELFSSNFAQLSEKGVVTLEPQDKKDIFNGGLEIIVKVGQGKYFDVTSLSGGEQSLVALSLIFAIQDLNPYCFYIFDEIDAALDRRNSEKLAHLLKKHMKKGQYLIITHNDSIISESSNILYGVSMQEGISKVLSLEV
ncbi:MAG: hypothetical protein RL557_716 [archaeon]|jgi:chromosome segregation protein